MTMRDPVGVSAPRAAARKLVAGAGNYTDDILLPGMLHVAFVRSPVAHGKLLSVDVSAACESPGVVRIVTGGDLADICLPLMVDHAALPAYRNASQPVLAVEEVCWQGMPIAAVVATSRCLAEDAADLIFADIDELPTVSDPVHALDPDAPPRVTGEPSNVALSLTLGGGDIEEAFSGAFKIVEHRFDFGRQTGVPLETRSIIADYRQGADTLWVTQSHQAPHQQRELIAKHLGLDTSRVHVRCPDVGGAFGIKLHLYPDELAVCAISKLLGRPIKFIADRMEAFMSDAHAREAQVRARASVDANGLIKGIEFDAVWGLGAFSSYPRGSVGEALQAIQLIGAPYRVPAISASVRAAYQNKPPTGAYRGVGQPIGVAVTEQLMDLAARATGLDPVEIRRRNHVGPEPTTSRTGLKVGQLSLDPCLDELLATMDYRGLRSEQERLRKSKIYRGIGIANFVELTAVGPELYGEQKLSIAAGEGCTLRLESDGHVTCESSATDQGQGTTAGIAQVVAGILGVPLEAVVVSSNGTSSGLYGGGAWASRGIAIGGEAALMAAKSLRMSILAIAGSLLQTDPNTLDIQDGIVLNESGLRISVSEVANFGHFRQHQLPLDPVPPLTVTRHFVPRTFPYLTANGVHAAYVEVDVETGIVKVIGYWVVEDCGRVINPLLVDEQIRGGVVQGIGGALYEHCRYDGEGQLLNGSLADYAVPMACEMPDIVVRHVETPTHETELGAKGAGEAGTVGALGAMWTAVNDALAPMGAHVTHQPFTPDNVLQAILASGNGPEGD